MQQMTIRRRGEKIQNGDTVTVLFEVQSVVSKSIEAGVLINASVTFEVTDKESESDLDLIARDALLAVLDPA